MPSAIIKGMAKAKTTPLNVISFFGVGVRTYLVVGGV